MNNQKVDIKNQINKWFLFPDQLTNGRFKGYEIRDDETQNQGAFVVGQNVTFNSARIPMTRRGYEVIGTEQSDATPVKRAWVFETRDGVQWELKAFDTSLYGWIVGVSTEYSLLKTGFTSSLEFGFGNIGKSSETTNHTYFCNGTDDFYRFNGVYGLYASDNGADQITLQGSTTLANLGFYASGSIIINGVAITYTGLSGQTFTGCSAVPVGPTVGDLVIQQPEQLTGGATPIKGQVVMAHDGRLHSRNEAKKSVWNYSKLDDPSNYTTGSTDGDGGAKEVESGGPLTAFGKLNKVILAFKKRLIKTLEFTQVGTRLDSPVYKTLVTVDDKSTSLGATNQKSTFSTPAGLVFVTPDKRMMLLTGVTANNEPQYLNLSDTIQPIFNTGVHDEASGICVENIIWYSFKTDINSTYNDVVLRGDMSRQAITADGKIIPVVWDTPYIGWNVNDWTAIFNSETQSNEVHWHSSINSNTYRIIDDKVDNTMPFTTTIRTWSENFGMPYNQKKIDYIYLEVKMTENTELLATLLYDEDGVTQTKEYTLRGTDSQIFNSAIYNPFGASAFGSQKIGSNPSFSKLKKFRYWLETDNNKWFFNLSLQLSTDAEGCDFELIRFGYRVTEVAQDMDLTYKKNIN